jgi:superfamily II DNA or RNA helicase
MNRRKFFFNKKPTKKDLPKDLKYEPSDEYKSTICSIAYLGKKGYTIPKSALEKADEEFLRKDLFVKPEIQGPTYGAPTENTEFPVFRENANKMYLPRFYGIQRYGVPHRSEIQSGDDIDVTFSKPLRDYQTIIVDVYMNYVNRKICSQENINIDKKYTTNGSGGILDIYTGSGKTVMALKIVSLLKKKTLIIVHKEFLMNQWIERIEEYLPGATVGKIQGPVFDVEGKDIVIGMVQTLYDKEYPAEAFTPFGLTIIDEVHRIGSEQFSKTLFKTITPYMLGISATVERKDKLTKILYMFIGEKIYSIKRDGDDSVSVRGIKYIANDPEFNETEMDFRGNAKYSTMITKLCNFGPRSDFIIRVIKDLTIEQPNSQIMILCHNRSLLTYLYDGIVHRGFTTVGYYVGGMKQNKLQETEEKQIVLATYAMAAEALDIKTLSTLVMITPKTDITQSVGRILRMKHDNPIIVDIIDSHDVFQKQWLQRKRFYKKCNYQIWENDSTKYTNMEMDAFWKKTFEPSKSKDAANNVVDPDETNFIENSFQGKCMLDVSNL